MSLTASAQCNGQTEVCDKRYDEVAYLTTHNAFNTGSESFSFPNQNNGIAQQLQDGVRAFMLDIYDFWGNTVVYHGSWTLGYQDIQDDLGEIETFLLSHPNEVVTLILECYVDANTIEDELDEAGLTSFLFTKNAGQQWPTIQEMIDLNQRLVVFSDENDASSQQGWYHYMWDQMTETHYSVNSPQDFTDEYNRGDSLNDLFIFNHFVTNATLGIGSESDAITVNAHNFLLNRISEHYDSHHKFPNFITLDFYDQGDGLAVVNELNAGYLSTDILTTESWLVYPNPAANTLFVEGIVSERNFRVEIYNPNGKKVLESFTPMIDCSLLKQGLYLVAITNGHRSRRFKVIVE
ncbi:phosphatidylinositol-specific phospholipase C domain-containing protein [Parvicella tangerina]|uniref:Secretion system C-terminal sorting domain-containing protein n=1 Tax=Parvicella tangerina TaxID=2829795 RepID=A0A916JMA2_9FLAO|nr:phosphatidylinositol-specific phospholipase C domain-containing protein [Parvicella tangerina]CAG5081641.1 hypothetical protein CRYO30217_01691 [Parvicella tangerina]